MTALDKEKLLTWLDNEYIPYVEDNADDGVRICLFIEEIIEETTLYNSCSESNNSSV